MVLKPGIGQSQTDLTVSANRRYLVKKSNGDPFYYMGCTAWEMLYNLNRSEVIIYLDNRAAKGFTAIQVSLISIFKGTGANAQGDHSFNNGLANPVTTPGNNPSNATEYDFWDHVEYVITEAKNRGMYVSLTCTWSNALNLINTSNAEAYGRFLGDRFKTKTNIIWILAGDAGTSYQTNATWRTVWANLARGIAIGTSGTENYDNVLISWHPNGASDTKDLSSQVWLDFNLSQTGQSDRSNIVDKLNLLTDMENITPKKPFEDYEPAYEGIFGRAGTNFDIRRYNYWSVFAGAFGHTYGHTCIFQMSHTGSFLYDGCNSIWDQVLNTEIAGQMKYLKNLMLSRPYLSRVPDQSLITDALGNGEDHIKGTRGDGYLFIYSARGKAFTVNMGKISGTDVNGYWYNPRTGAVQSLGTFSNSGTRAFTPSSNGDNNDWVLVLDDASKGFPAPGQK